MAASSRNTVADEAYQIPMVGRPARLLPRLAPGVLRRGEGRFIAQVAGGFPSTDSLDGLVHHFDLKDGLGGISAARPRELVREHGSAVLALEEAGGKPIVRLLKASIEIGAFSNSGSPPCERG